MTLEHSLEVWGGGEIGTLPRCDTIQGETTGSHPAVTAKVNRHGILEQASCRTGEKDRSQDYLSVNVLQDGRSRRQRVGGDSIVPAVLDSPVWSPGKETRVSYKCRVLSHMEDTCFYTYVLIY